MNAREFYDKVVEMREAQKRYFRTRASMDLTACRKLERDIDNEIMRVGEITGRTGGNRQQTMLFPPDTE